jgi:uncharacterized protein
MTDNIIKNITEKKPPPAKNKQQTAPAVYAKSLESYFARQHGAIIAFSGGVDSGLLAYAAHLALDKHMIAVIADSPSLSRREFQLAEQFTGDHNIPLHIIKTDEMSNPRYRANQGNRCYYCKKSLFETIEALRKERETALFESSWPIFYGANTDDQGDHRPGMVAAQEAAILAPYIELGMDKNTIRKICAYYGLEIADKPAMPCLSSRIAYGETVTDKKLAQVEQAENFLYKLGLQVMRVRHHGDTARIEVQPEDFPVLIKNRNKISRKFHELGFIYVAMDMDGFKSGSLNAVLKKES